ncbi:MAG TPA: type II secretion system protein GspM [Acidobacteriota bacterium]|nr:type II secretion system protein GspM [Acidobacteriota bacterium]
MRKLSKRDKRALIGGGVAVLLYLLVFHLILPFYDAGTSIDSQLEQKKRMLQAGIRTIQEQKVYAAQLTEVEKVLEQYQQRLLDARDATTAATQLDEIVRMLASQNNVTLTKSNPLPERKVGDRYAKVTIQINLDADLASATAFLYSLSTHPKFLAVENFSVSKFRMTSTLQPRMDVSGFIRLS